jgi:tetratricopeptide (TPR) repeat protein
MKSPALYLGALLVLLLASCDGFLYQEPTTEISRDDALDDAESVESALYGAYNLTMRRGDTYRSFLTYYADLAGGNATFSPGLSSGAETELRRIEAFDGLSDETVEAYTALYELLYAVNNVANAVPDLPDATDAQKDRLLGQALGLRAMVHFDLVRLYAQPYRFTDDASHIGIVVLTESPRPDEQIPRTSVDDAYDQIVDDLEQSIELLDGEPFNPRFINAVNARALLSRVYLYQGEWANVVTLCNEVIDSEATTLAPTEDLVEMWENGYTRNEFLLRLDGSANVTYTLSAEWGNRVSDTGPTLTATSDIIDLYPDGDRRGLGPDRLIRETDDDGNTVFSPQKYPEPPSQEPNNVSVIRLAEVYLNRAEAYANLNRDDPAQDDLNTIRRRAHPSAEPVTATGAALIDEILLERRKELAFEGHLLFDRTRNGRGVERDYCDGATWCNEAYPNPRFILPIPLDAMNANDALVQNDGY